jgi:hypothetical protein
MKKRIRKKKASQKLFNYFLSKMDEGISVQEVVMCGYDGVRFERLIKKLWKHSH